MQVGDIVYFKNIVFDGGKADHAFDVGRPCVYIGTLNGKMYFVPLTNVYTLKHNIPYTIKPNRQNCLRKESHPNFKQIVEKKESFYEVSGYLSEQEMIMNLQEQITDAKTSHKQKVKAWYD